VGESITGPVRGGAGFLAAALGSKELADRGQPRDVTAGGNRTVPSELGRDFGDHGELTANQIIATDAGVSRVRTSRLARASFELPAAMAAKTSATPCE